MTLGRLTDADALVLCHDGISTADLAARAGVSADRATAWRCAHGVSRKTTPTGLSTADKRTYQREWKRLRKARAA